MYESIKKQSSGYQFNKCGIAMASTGNINKEIQLIIDVIDYKMFNPKQAGGGGRNPPTGWFFPLLCRNGKQ